MSSRGIRSKLRVEKQTLLPKTFMTLQKSTIAAIATLFYCGYSFAQTPSEEEQTVTILCLNKIDRRDIEFDPSSQVWCDKDISSYCGPTHQEVARQVCSDRYKRKLAALGKDKNRSTIAVTEKDDTPEKSNTPEVEDARSDLAIEREKLEQRRIELEQQKRDLQNRESELLEKKRAQDDSL